MAGEGASAAGGDNVEGVAGTEEEPNGHEISGKRKRKGEGRWTIPPEGDSAARSADVPLPLPGLAGTTGEGLAPHGTGVGSQGGRDSPPSDKYRRRTGMC